MFASFLYVFIPAKYTTSGPKFYTKLVLAITRHRKRVRRSYRLESSPNCLNIANSLSKQDFQKSDFSSNRPNYTVFNDSNVEKCKNQKNVETYFWPVLQYVKKYAEFNGAIHFAWNLIKLWVFDFHFCHFLYFYIFYRPSW